jgi:L-lysine exporter family protein LysE/ArgO
VVEEAPWALQVVRWVGVAFLVWYAVGSLRRARAAESLHAEGRPRGSVRGAVVRTFALTWLNPHVYLDTVLLLGTVANQHGPVGRWWFAVGAAVASTVWFGGLGFGARLLAPLLARPRAWQALDVLIAVTMLAIAAALALG